MPACRLIELSRKHGGSDAFNSRWCSTCGGMTGSDGKRLNALETDNTRLMPLLAEQVRDNAVIRDVLRKNRRRTGPSQSGAPHDRSGPERASLTVRGHERAPIATRNAQIATWNATYCTPRHALRCVAVRNDLLKRHPEGTPANRTQVERFYREEGMQGRRCQRKNVTFGDW